MIFDVTFMCSLIFLKVRYSKRKGHSAADAQLDGDQSSLSPNNSEADISSVEMQTHRPDCRDRQGGGIV